MAEAKEKLPDNESGEKKEKIPPLNLNTPDLTPRERQLLESVSEKLVGEQIERIFGEDPDLQKAAREFPPLRPGEKVPKEEDIVRAAKQRQETKESKPAALEEARSLIVSVDEFRRVPEKINWYADWLTEVAKNFGIQPLRTLSREKQEELKSVMQSVEQMQSVEKKQIVWGYAAIEMANAINRWIHVLREVGIPASALSRNAFHVWLNAQNMGEEEAGSQGA